MQKRLFIAALLASQLAFAAPWQATNTYKTGQTIQHQGKDWQARWQTRNEEPGLHARGSWMQRPIITSQRQSRSWTPPPAPTVPTLQQALTTETTLTNNDFFRSVKATIRTLPNSEVEAVVAGRAANPANVKRVERILTPAKWEHYFSRRDPAYTYQRFLQAVAKFPAFCGDYTDGRDSDLICRRGLATAFAHFAQETGDHNRNDTVPEWRQALKHLREMGCTDGGNICGYNAECDDPVFNKVWTCGKNADGSWRKYFGRGAKQLSYNYNYGPFSQAMFDGNQHVLLQDPDKVASTWLNLASAIFFYVYPQPPKPSMLHVIDGTWVPNAADKAAGAGNNFATTIMIINAECGGGTERASAQNRIDYYKQFAHDLGWDYSKEQLSCANMQRFSGASSAAYNIYWEMDWRYGNDYKCQLVSYQTPYSALQPGNYQRCVESNWKVKLQ